MESCISVNERIRGIGNLEIPSAKLSIISASQIEELKKKMQESLFSMATLFAPHTTTKTPRKYTTAIFLVSACALLNFADPQRRKHRISQQQKIAIIMKEKRVELSYQIIFMSIYWVRVNNIKNMKLIICNNSIVAT